MGGQSKFKSAGFCSWDTEGVDLPDFGHTTALVCNSAGAVLRYTSQPFTSREMFDFCATELQQRKHLIHVAFAFSYDVNMFCRSLPRETVERLWQTGAARLNSVHGRYSFRYTPRKSFSIWRERDGVKAGGTIWDTFGFFQQSFVAACKAYGFGADLELIERMKKQRAAFTLADLAQMQEYCLQECALLVRVMEKLREYLKEAELPVARWDGAGAVAASLLSREGVVQFKSSDLPPAVDRASEHGYFGGRIESLRYGHVHAPIYVADVRSAYPASAMNLPCLACGSWSFTKRRPEGARFAISSISWKLPAATLYPFPWRSERTGAVYFPSAGRGWYWEPEVTAARQVWKRGIQEHGTWTYTTNCKHAPFDFIGPLYVQRARWKREGRGAEKALKLALNACYGKLAQRISMHGKPRYQELAWAGWITSNLRARMFRAAWPVREHLVMICTDSLAALVPLDHLPESELIGEWEHEIFAGATVVQSGFYWFYKPGGEIGKSRTRGYSGNLDPKAIAKAYAAGAFTFEARERNFCGMGQALQTDWQKWRQWNERPRILRLLPTGKRERIVQERAWGILQPTRATLPLYDMAAQGDQSAPIQLGPVSRNVDREIGTVD